MERIEKLLCHFKSSQLWYAYLLLAKATGIEEVVLGNCSMSGVVEKMMCLILDDRNMKMSVGNSGNDDDGSDK